MKNRRIVFHPFLFILFPMVALYANNLGELPFAATLRAVGFGLAGTALVVVLLRLLLKDWHRAGIITTLAAVLFFIYGRVYHWAAHALGAQPVPLAVIWVSLFALGFWLVAIRLRGPALEITRILNITAGIALATCLWGFGSYSLHVLQINRVLQVHAEADAQAGVPARPTSIAQVPASDAPPAPPPQLAPSATQASINSAAAQPPDIYYIILDAHGRSDVLQEMFGVDNQPFIDFLRKRGFYVADQTHSNYDQTALSLASSLNFDYLDQKMEMIADSNDRGPLLSLINDSQLQSFLKEQGYRTIAFNNGFPATEMVKADTFIQDPAGLNNFEMTLISGALGQEEFNPQIIDSYRQRILWSEGELEKQVADWSDPRPKFVFAHFILPHPPFVFNADGTPRFSVDGGDGSAYTGSHTDYWSGYREQVQYADVLAEQMITAILANSARPPVIIVQGDHGSGLDLDWGSQANTCLRERFSILNAYYLPGANAQKSLYPSITPVNTFRVVLNDYFKTDLPLLADRSYYSGWTTPYATSEVTDQMEATCPSKRIGE